jgi:hypothetical protein
MKIVPSPTDGSTRARLQSQKSPQAASKIFVVVTRYFLAIVPSEPFLSEAYRHFGLADLNVPC